MGKIIFSVVPGGSVDSIMIWLSGLIFEAISLIISFKLLKFIFLVFKFISKLILRIIISE